MTTTPVWPASSSWHATDVPRSPTDTGHPTDDDLQHPPHVYLSSNDYDVEYRLPVIDPLLGEPLKVLLSFHYFRDANLDDLMAQFRHRPQVFADSGAYSAASQGVPISVADYSAWLDTWKHHFTVYSNLDVIRDPDMSQRNLDRLERDGHQPIPVFHTGSPFSELDRLARTYPYIALGGMVGQSRPACLKWSATCMKRVEDHNIRFHGFGMTSQQVIDRLPWYSVDSSSWLAAARYGNLSMFDGRKWVRADIGDPRQIAKVAHLIRYYGLDPDQFSDADRYRATTGHINVCILSGLSWRRYEKHLRHKNRNLNSIYLANDYMPHHVALDHAIRPQPCDKMSAGSDMKGEDHG